MKENNWAFNYGTINIIYKRDSHLDKTQIDQPDKIDADCIRDGKLSQFYSEIFEFLLLYP